VVASAGKKKSTKQGTKSKSRGSKTRRKRNEGDTAGTIAPVQDTAEWKSLDVRALVLVFLFCMSADPPLLLVCGYR
jgi:hypothetical protein